MNPSRRQALGLIFERCAAMAALATTGALATGHASAQTPTSCYDPASLPFTQKSRRRALGYLDASTAPKKRCGLCAFFTGTASGCGTCQMLSGAPVNAAGLCNSFALKVAG